MSKQQKVEELSFPHMFFHPKSGDYVICNTPSEVPQGFVDSIKKVDAYDDNSPQEIKKASVYVTPAVAQEEGPTLKSLGISRKEATKLLKSAGIEVKSKAKDTELAALISEHFDAEDAEDDDSK